MEETANGDRRDGAKSLKRSKTLKDKVYVVMPCAALLQKCDDDAYVPSLGALPLRHDGSEENENGPPPSHGNEEDGDDGVKKPGDGKNSYCQQVLRPLFYYMMWLGLNHTYRRSRVLLVYNYAVLSVQVLMTLRKISQIGIRSPGQEDEGFRTALFDPAVVITICYSLFFLSGTLATGLLLRLQYRRHTFYRVLEEGLVHSRKGECLRALLNLNRWLVFLAFASSVFMGAVHCSGKMGFFHVPWSPVLIATGQPWCTMEGYVVFLSQSSLVMVASFFAQLCCILRRNIVRLVAEMLYQQKDTCPTKRQALRMIHTVQRRYQAIYNGRTMIEDNFSMALLYTYACCIPVFCFLSYIIIRSSPDTTMSDKMSLCVWMVDGIFLVAFFSLPAFAIKEHGERLLSACFRMYHETLCEQRDELVLSAMMFLTFQVQTTTLTLTAGRFFEMTRRIVLTLVSAIITYFVVLVQFDSFDSKAGNGTIGGGPAATLALAQHLIHTQK